VCYSCFLIGYGEKLKNGWEESYKKGGYFVTILLSNYGNPWSVVQIKDWSLEAIDT